jgi:OmpA-OmpF porin, OOP family
MNRKSLCVLIGLSLTAVSAQAQDFDDRWYFAPWIGYYDNDSDRNTDDGSLYGSLGIGRFIAPNSAIDVFVDHTSRTRKPQPPFESGWDNTGVGVALRQHFGDDAWRPYLMGGVGVSHHDVGDDGTIRSIQGWDPFVQVGVGVAYHWTDNVDFRTEAVYRLDFDDESQHGEDDYGDFMLNLGLVVYLGGAPEPAPEVVEEVAEAETPVADCTTMDDDHDGVNNCDDKCPGSTPGQNIGPDGCPVPEPAPEEVMEPQEYKG